METPIIRLSDRTYDTTKYIAMIFLPALSVALQNLCSVWGIPFGDKIPPTLDIVSVFVGTALCVSSINYRKEQAETSSADKQ